MIKLFKPIENYLSILVSGFNGCGKTTLVKTLDEKAKILYLSFEGGLDSISNWSEENKSRVDILEITDVMTDIDVLVKHNLSYIIDKKKFDAGILEVAPNPADYQDLYKVNYDYVFIDSITAIGKSIEISVRSGKIKSTFDDWNLIQDKGCQLFYYLLKLQCHKIFIGHCESKDNNIISLRMNGNIFKGAVLDEVNFSFYYNIMNGQRNLITSDDIGTSRGVLNLCKKRDEKLVLKDVEEANLNNIIKKLRG